MLTIKRSPKTAAWLFLIAGFTALLFFSASQNPAAAQQGNSTPAAPVQSGTTSGNFITVTYQEPINVRSGPSSFDYPVIGTLPAGGTVPALGRSPAGEWIQIEFPSAPQGKGWVYAAYVTLSAGALLPVVEPPPTPAPEQTPTLNPTFVAAYQILPTSTRLPTFTAPPPLVIPTFASPVRSSPSRSITTWVIVVLGMIGVVGFILSSLKRR